MAQGKIQIPNFIKSTDARKPSTDPTDENLSTVDVGKDFVSSVAQPIVHPVTGTNVVNTKSRKD